MKAGDIVQIVDEAHPWYPCLLIVGEVKSWGVQASCLIPGSNDGTKPVSEAWNRLRIDQVERVGEAVVWHAVEEQDGKA